MKLLITTCIATALCLPAMQAMAEDETPTMMQQGNGTMMEHKQMMESNQMMNNHQMMRHQQMGSQKNLSDRLKKITLPANASPELKSAYENMVKSGEALQSAKMQFQKDRMKFHTLMKESKQNISN